MPLWLIWPINNHEDTHTAEVPEVQSDGITEVAPNDI